MIKIFPKIDDVCADDSLFAKVLKTGQPIINLYREEECKDCSNKIGCREYANMIYPIKDRDKIIGVLCFASFDKFQADMMRVKQEEYYNMLKETASIVEREIKRVNVTNKLKKNTTEVNEIIKTVDDPYAHLLKINLKNHGFLIGADKLETLEYLIKDITDKHYVKMR